MSKRENRLKPIINIAGSREQAAASELAKLVRTQRDVAAQLDKLRAYRFEYNATSTQGRQSTEAFSDHRRFLVRLNESIQRLEEHYSIIEKKRLMFLAKWQRLRSRAQSLENLAIRQQDIFKKETLRAEQKEIDDIAGRSAHHRENLRH